jgi:hypothetical protein
MSCTNTTTINNSCENPYQHLFFELVGTKYQGPPQQNNQSPAEILDRILDKGVVMQGNCNLCCPDCNNIHIIAGVETMIKALYGGYYPAPICQHQNSFNNLNCGASSQFCGILDDRKNYTKCCNGFTEGIEDILCIARRHTTESGFLDKYVEVIDRISDKGIVEYGTISGESQLKYLVDWLSQIEGMIPNIVDSTYAEVIDRILDKGIVIWCDKENDKYVISSVETFIRGLPCNEEFIEFDSTSETCCLNIYTSIEIYTIFLQASNCDNCGPTPS